MEETKIEKKTVRTAEEKKALNSRINKLIGQLNGVRRMIEDDRYCEDVLIQLSAVEKSVRSLSNLVLEKHIHGCLANNLIDGDLSTLDEIVALIKRYQ